MHVNGTVILCPGCGQPMVKGEPGNPDCTICHKPFRGRESLGYTQPQVDL